MPNYSETIIFKFQHDDNEELVYVGSTTHFTERKSRHKSNCNNPKSHNIKLYKMINDNGGWDCFKFIQIKTFPCNDKREAEAEEDRIMLELKANMNSNRAFRDKREYYLDNVEQIKENRKENRLENIDKFKENDKQYFSNNRDTILEKKKLSVNVVVKSQKFI